VLLPSLADQPQVRFVHQGGGLERLPGLLADHLLGRQPTQLVVDERQQLLGGVRVALLDRGQDVGDLGHRQYREGEGLGRTTSPTRERLPETMRMRLRGGRARSFSHLRS
jgi:hypothetical protein